MLKHLKLKLEIKIKTINLSFCIDDEKLLEKYKAIWTKIENFKNIELNALAVYDDRFATIVFLIMDSNFKILHAMVVKI